MAQDKFLIAPLKSGLTTNRSAWMIPEDAFTKLNNAYIHKGKIRKRFGSTLLIGNQIFSRLRIYLGTTDGSGEFGISGAEYAPGIKWSVGQQFLITDGATALEVFTVVTDGSDKDMISTGSASVKTFSTTNGQIKLETSFDEEDVYYYPADVVMGITHYETGKPNNSPTYAFDTQFAYEKKSVGWEVSNTVPVTTPVTKDLIFHGADHQFFDSCNWLSVELYETALYVTNNNATIGTPGASDDPMYSFNGTEWTEFRPVFNVDASVTPNVVTGFVQTAKFIRIFNGVMFLFAPTENVGGVNKYYRNRVRWSIDGSPACPIIGGVFTIPYKSWLEDKKTWTIGSTTVESSGAGWVDAGTAEEIISVEFIRNRIIVYFERSTWEIVSTGNRTSMYSWHRLNAEVGSISANSTIGFDDAVLTLSASGVTACNGVVVKQADESIENDVFVVRDPSYGNQRVYGIRDFNAGMAYWTFPEQEAKDVTVSKFPNKVILFNYKENCWATADDCITCFGYSEQRLTDNYIPANVLAGNQQGFVYNISADVYKNAATLQITNILLYGAPGSYRVGFTIINHTLATGEFINISGVQGVTNISGIYEVLRMNFDLVTISVDTLTGTYTGGGYAARVSRIDIMSKQWNPYVEHGGGVYLAQIEFVVKRTTHGELTVDCYPSSTNLSMLEDGIASGAMMGTGILETSAYSASPLEAHQELLWHPVYFQAGGSSVQVRLFLSDTQMKNTNIAASNMVIEALLLHTTASSFHT